MKRDHVDNVIHPAGGACGGWHYQVSVQGPRDIPDSVGGPPARETRHACPLASGINETQKSGVNLALPWGGALLASPARRFPRPALYQ